MFLTLNKNTISNGNRSNYFIVSIHSWDEMAKFDLPAIVDKILSVTGAQQLFYVGHSQGTEIAFAQLSRDPVFASKVKMFVALAPAVYIAHVKTPLIILKPFAKDMEVIILLLYRRFSISTANS